MIKCINCKHCTSSAASNDSIIVFGTECIKYGVLAGYPEELKAIVIQEHDKSCKYAK